MPTKAKKSGGHKPPQKQAVRLRCADCVKTYDAGTPHSAFCAARTCGVCGETKRAGVHEQMRDGVTQQVCDDCIEDGQ